MAKLKGKAKAAFLRRMARGRAKARRSSGRSGVVRRTKYRRKLSFSGSMRPSRKRPGTVRIRLMQNPAALIANPSMYDPASGALVRYSPQFAAYQKRRHRKKRSGPMAKRRRKRRYSRRAAPVRRRRRTRAAGRRIRRARRVPRRYAHRYYQPRGKRRIYLNPRRRRYTRRRRNPGLRGGGMLPFALKAYAAGFVTSLATAVVDTALANYPMVKQIAKVGGAFLIAFVGRRRFPMAATAAIASLAGSQGYNLGTKLAGGFIAQSPAQATKGLGEMAQVYPEMGALLTGGIGALLTGMGGVDNQADVLGNYQTALSNMADDDDY